MDLDSACRTPTPRETAGRDSALDGLAGVLAADLDAGFERLVRSETDRLFTIACGRSLTAPRTAHPAHGIGPDRRSSASRSADEAREAEAAGGAERATERHA